MGDPAKRYPLDSEAFSAKARDGEWTAPAGVSLGDPKNVSMSSIVYKGGRPGASAWAGLSGVDVPWPWMAALCSSLLPVLWYALLIAFTPELTLLPEWSPEQATTVQIEIGQAEILPR